MTRDEALALMHEFTPSEALRRHMYAVEIAMRAMGLDQWAPRSFLSGELAQNGLVGFWSQTAPSAVVGGAMVARAVLDIVRGQRIPVSRAILKIRDAFGTADGVDESEPLYIRLQDLKASDEDGGS